MKGPEKINVNTKHYWDSIYRDEKDKPWRIYPKTFETIGKWVGSKKKILDVGCGQGILLNWLHRNGNDCTGLDISYEAVSQVNAKGIKAYACKIPPIPDFILEKGKFDFVIATEFLEHFPNPIDILNELKKASDNIIIAVPNDCLGPEENIEHFHSFNKKKMTNLLEFVDLKVDKMITYYDQFQTRDKNIRLPTLLAKVKVNSEDL